LTELVGEKSMPSEFALIERHFTRPTTHTLLGIGDDAAIVRPSPGMELLVSTDMLVAGTHFLAETDPAALGWKVLAVNVSDLAAMGAKPRWALLAASLPAATESWLAAFSEGFFACAAEFAIDVIGGDTTRGPRNFCVTIFGEAPPGQSLLRSGARPGDEVWVSGLPGRAALGLAHLQGRCVLAEPMLSDCLAALHRPQPRVALGLALRGLASAAIDVSDGLLADLGHILEQSGVSATVRLDCLPVLPSGKYEALALDCQLSGGDDYELVFTAAAARHRQIKQLDQQLGLALTCIGNLTEEDSGSLNLIDASGRPVTAAQRGYDHFG
jgi:thiamine-monophosphate kinase